MLPKTISSEKEHQLSTLQESFLDFMLSRQAMLCTPRTVKFYRDTLTKFLEWLEKDGLDDPARITARHVRKFLSSYAEKGCKDSYIHTYARSIRTYVRFLYSEEYIPNIIKFEMPRIGEMRLPVLNIEQVKRLLDSCSTPRDKAIILMMVDTGLRRSELCSLNWEDLDIKTGICIVRRGKGKKTRTVILGVATRRAILSYRRTLSHAENDPIFQTSTGRRLSTYGLRSLLVRLSEKSKVDVSAHALRRTFVVLSLRGGMSLAHVQSLMGHTTPKMTLHYARLSDEDLLSAHQAHGPIDTLF